MHPLTKIIIVFCLTTASLVYAVLPLQIAVLLISLLLVFSKKRDVLHSQKLKQNLFWLLNVGLMIFIVQTLFTRSGTVLWELGWIRITEAGLITASEVCIRLYILALLAAWLIGLSLKDYMDAFYLIRMPETLAVMTAMTIGFIPLLADQIADKRQQLMLRGINLQTMKLSERKNLFIGLLMPVLGKTMQEIKFQAIALDLRGFRNGTRHTRFEPVYLKPADWLVICGTVLLTFVPAFL